MPTCNSQHCLKACRAWLWLACKTCGAWLCRASKAWLWRAGNTCRAWLWRASKVWLWRAGNTYVECDCHGSAERVKNIYFSFCSLNMLFCCVFAITALLKRPLKNSQELIKISPLPLCFRGEFGDSQWPSLKLESRLTVKKRENNVKFLSQPKEIISTQTFML